MMATQMMSQGKARVRRALMWGAGVVSVAMVLGGVLLAHRRHARLNPIRHIPDFGEAVSMPGETPFHAASELDSALRTAVLFFHPQCTYCKRELSGIVQRHAECRSVQWVFVSLAYGDELLEFLRECPLHKISHAHVIYAEGPWLWQRYSVKAPPALFLYDDTGRLFWWRRSAVPVETLVKQLQ